MGAIVPSSIARRLHDNLICFDCKHVEELEVLRRLLPNDGSHPYKESPYDLGPNIEPRTRYLDKYNTELPNLHNNKFRDNNTYAFIQDLLNFIFCKLHIDTQITVQFTNDTKMTIYVQ